MRNLEKLAQEAGKKYNGWRSKDTAKAFAEYAGHVAEQLGDRVKHYFTINEFRSFAEGGYQGFDVQVGGGKTVHLGGGSLGGLSATRKPSNGWSIVDKSRLHS